MYRLHSFLAQLALLLCLIIVPVSSIAQDDTGPSGTITAESDAALDASIATRIREILQELGDYGDVTVTVNEGIVTLRGETDTAAAVDDLDGIVSRIEGVVQIRNQVSQTADIARQLNPAWERFRARMAQVVAFLPLFIIALAVFLAIVFFGFLIARLRAPFDRIAPNAFIADLLRQVVRLFFFVIAIVAALDIMDATALLSTILGAAGLIGLAIGFAVRDTVENFIASVMLSIRQPFRPNDAVEINGDEGKVIRLTSRATILLSWDGNHIRIPNATVFKSRIVNYSRNAERRLKGGHNWIYSNEVDTKATPLKTLQGMVWASGYESGAYQAHVYADAFHKLTQWREMGLSLHIFSSGSVQAQKLF